MSDPSTHSDHLRIGDAEREQASAMLREHFAEGRLDADEHAERLDAVWASRTRGDLRPIFRDLPGGSQESPASRSSHHAPPSATWPPRRARRPWQPLPVLLVLVAVAVVAKAPFLILVALICWALMHRRGHLHR